MEHYEKSAFENQLFIMLQSIIIFSLVLRGSEFLSVKVPVS